MIENIQQKLLHFMAYKDYSISFDYDEKYFEKGFAETEKFFERFENRIGDKFEKNRFLDVGHGYGTTCIYLGLRGAKQVTGIEIRQTLVDFANQKLENEYPYLKGRVEFKLAKDMGDEKFDTAISKDSFEHYEDPLGYLQTISGWLKEKGIIYLGFAPLWKSPYGGHIDYVTKFPWAHLIFSEKTILEERKRLTGEDISSYSEISGGLNQMTLEKFRNILAESNFTPLYLRTNISNRKIIKLFNLLRNIPFCEEYFTVNAYTILQKNGT